MRHTPSQSFTKEEGQKETMEHTLLNAITTLQESGDRGILVVVVQTEGHTPQVVGAKMLVREDGSFTGTVGGGSVEEQVLQRALAMLRNGTPPGLETIHLGQDLGMCCGGQMSFYLEPVVPMPTLILFGAGHVAQPTARFAQEAGFSVSVVDDRKEWNTASRFPAAHERSLIPYMDYLADFAPAPETFVVIVTQGHEHDEEILRHCLQFSLHYLGMIGSVRKVAKTLRRMPPRESWKTHPHCPIGLDIKAETPAEIAISIVGELIRTRRQMAPPIKQTTGAAVSSRDRSSENTEEVS